MYKDRDVRQVRFGNLILQFRCRYSGTSIKQTNLLRAIFFSAPVIVKYMKKNLSETKPCYSEQILPVPWPFVLMEFHCSRIYGVLKHTLYAHCYFFSGYLLQLTFYGILAFLGFMLQALTMSPAMPAQRVHRQITVSTEYKYDSPSCCKANEVENIFLTRRTQSWSMGSSVQRFIRSYGDSKFSLFCCHPPLPGVPNQHQSSMRSCRTCQLSRIIQDSPGLQYGSPILPSKIEL